METDVPGFKLKGLETVFPPLGTALVLWAEVECALRGRWKDKRKPRGGE